MILLSLPQAILRCLTVLACILVTAHPALGTNAYVDNADGTITDSSTGLTWMRCTMGQTWSGSSCSGARVGYTWDQARALTNAVGFAGKTDWRLPSIRELQTIVDRTLFLPSIDRIVFPGTPSSYYWSGSAHGFPNFAWGVNFGNGYSSYFNRFSEYRVRLVRGGLALGLLDIARPSADFVNPGDGTVVHTPTGLIWQRCAVGQIWTGSTCAGSAAQLSWTAAKELTSNFAGKPDWRLPSTEELLSLVDFSTSGPAITLSMFPNTPSVLFWSGSTYAESTGLAWNVNFNFGNDYYSSLDGTSAVRLVRSGQSLDTLANDVDAVFAWAQRSFPEIFTPNAQASQSNFGIRYRVYVGDHILAVNESGTAHLFYIGPISSNEVLNLGPLSDWVVLVKH